ncbi:HAD family hydrolase [Halorussus halophilus]|uniref:HAD family hydrolase n=1 Tax=Halorussus halophilus TaxID=2650975 RepID=UPI001787ECAE|nr:HAD family phosphatase [Halorussus halophilus]
MKSKAVLFDMDGVIVDSERHWVPTEEEEIFPDVVADGTPTDETTGMNFREIYDYLDANYETTVEKDAFVERYEEAARDIYGEKVELMTGFEDLVADLRAEGVQIALVSSSPPDWIERMLDRFDLHDAFDEVISAEHIAGDGKPAPDIYEHAAVEVGVEPEECVAVEDSENGIAAAKAAGMACIGYRNKSEEVLDLSEADAVVDSPDALRDELLG